MAKVLIDGNYSVCRCVYSGGSLTSQGRFTGGVYKLLRILWNIRSLGELVMVYDGGRSEFRTSLYPEYKKKSKKEDHELTEDDKRTKEAFNFTYSTLDSLLPKMGIPSIRIKNQEADDILFRLAQAFKLQGEEVYVISDDNDMLQFVNMDVRVYRPMKDEYFTLNNFIEKMGFDPKYFTLYKSLIGDGSDNIPGCSGIGDVRAKKIIKDLPDPEIGSLITWCNGGSDSLRTKVKENLPLIKRNLLLMDLKYCDIDKDVEPVEGIPLYQNFETFKTFLVEREKAKKDIKMVMDIFKDLEFTTLNNWIGYLAE